MDYTIVPMSRQHLDEMDTWTYGPFFPDFDTTAYHNSADAGAEPLTGPAGCHGYAVLAPDGELVGLFEYYLVEDGSASIGLALKPEMTGRGRGAGFLPAGIEFLLSHHGYRHPYVYLDVALTNEPARKLYERSGFERLGSVAGDHQSVLMRKELPEHLNRTGRHATSTLRDPPGQPLVARHTRPSSGRDANPIPFSVTL